MDYVIIYGGFIQNIYKTEKELFDKLEWYNSNLKELKVKGGKIEKDKTNIKDVIYY